MRALLAALTLVLLAGCGTLPPDKPALGDGFNDTDVMFAQMIASHQAIAAKYLEVVAKRSSSNEVKTLAAAIQVTEADEAKQVKAWLDTWQKPLDVDVRSALHASHGGLPSTGEAELKAIQDAPDAEFDKTFLNIFIGHQHQAVEFARMEIAAGQHRESVSLAHRVDKSRRAQIEMMLKMVA